MKLTTSNNNMAFLGPDEDGTLPAAGWVTLPAGADPVKAALKLCSSSRPTTIYLSQGPLRQSTGIPAIVTKYTLEWGTK